LPKIVTIAYNMKGCLRFSTFILWIVPNLVKYTCGWLSLEQYWKIGKKNLVLLACNGLKTLQNPGTLKRWSTSDPKSWTTSNILYSLVGGYPICRPKDSWNLKRKLDKFWRVILRADLGVFDDWICNFSIHSRYTLRAPQGLSVWE